MNLTPEETLSDGLQNNDHGNEWKAAVVNVAQSSFPNLNAAEEGNFIRLERLDNGRVAYVGVFTSEDIGEYVFSENTHPNKSNIIPLGAGTRTDAAGLLQVLREFSA